MNWQYLEGPPATAHFVVALSGAFMLARMTHSDVYFHMDYI
jgi:hypothetical protein